MLATTMEAEPEVMGTPGRVADMIARFSHLTTAPDTSMVTPKPVVKLNGTSPGDCDVTDNVMTNDDVKPVFRPIIKDLTLAEPHNNNNNKLVNNVDHTKQLQHETEEEGDNIIMNYRKKLRPVANSVILAEGVGDNDVTHVDSHVTTHVTSPAVTVNGQYGFKHHCSPASVAKT